MKLLIYLDVLMSHHIEISLRNFLFFDDFNHGRGLVYIILNKIKLKEMNRVASHLLHLETKL